MLLDLKLKAKFNVSLNISEQSSILIITSVIISETDMRITEAINFVQMVNATVVLDD